MTRVDFHFNVPDRADYACRLLRKVLNKGGTAVVTGNAAALASLNDRLWGFAETAFLGHAWLEQENNTQALRTCARVWLTEHPAQCERHELLVSLSDTVVSGFEHYDRLIEIVSQVEPDRQNARERWRYYTARGYGIVKHDVAVGISDRVT